MVGEVVEPFDAGTATMLFTVAPLVVAPALLMTGVAVLGARRWSGWRRAIPLACAVYLLVVFIPVVAVTGTDAGFFMAVIGWDLGIAALGLAVVAESKAPGRA